MQEATIKFSNERCFGCGRCIDECPEDAIHLEKTPGRGIPIPFV
jgi:ferredoxin